MFTFSLGDGADFNFCDKLAEKGRGTHTKVTDGGQKALKVAVVEALHVSMDPKYIDCRWGYPGRKCRPTDLIRNQQVFDAKIMTLESFEA